MGTEELLRVGEAVEDPGFVDAVRMRLWDTMLGRPTRSPSFPGAQPVSFTRAHIATLTTEDYYVCEKSDGVRYLLYMCAPFGEPLGLLIDRNFTLRALPGFATPTRTGAMHEETLLDGELVDEDGSLVFLIFDALLVAGRCLLPMDLNGRLAAVQNDVVGPATLDGPLTLRLKKMWKPYAIAEILEREIPAQRHGNDGLIFTPVCEPYRAGTCPRLFKWKPPEMNTVDFVIRVNALAADENERIELHVAGDGGRNRLFAFHDWDPAVAALDGCVAECRYVAAPPPKWLFLKVRSDKVSANYERIARAIVESIADNVTAKELVAAIPAIRRAWRARHPS